MNNIPIGANTAANNTLLFTCIVLDKVTTRTIEAIPTPRHIKSGIINSFNLEGFSTI